jgi:hypothetical protein
MSIYLIEVINWISEMRRLHTVRSRPRNPSVGFMKE